MKIKGNTFFVTGGASGLGLATVEKLLEAGANVTVADLQEEKGREEARRLGDRALFQVCNVTDEKSVQAAIDSTVAKFGALHGVINCAGVGLPRRILSSRGAVHDLKGFNFVQQVNLVGTFNVLRLAVAQMAKQEPVGESGERGVIINTASVAAEDGQIGQAAYSASKAGVVGMTLPAARDLADKGIRVNTVAPGLFWTPMMAGLPEKARKSLIKQVPFPSRFGRPDEFGDLACSIVQNQYINGTTIRLDGSIRMAAM